MLDADRGPHHLNGERLHDVGRDPGRAEPGGDVGGLQVLGLHLAERVDVAPVLRVERRGRFGRLELAADGAGQVGVRRFPMPGARVAEHGGPELGEGLVGAALQQLGQVVGIDPPHLAQRHRQRVRGAGDDRGGRGRDDPFAEHRPHAGQAAVEVVVLNGGHQPAVGIVQERGEVRAAVRLPLLTRLRVGRRGDDGVVDRPEGADEGRVGYAQPDLVLLPGRIGRLGAQDLAHRVTDRQQGADDPDGPWRDPAAALALAYGDGREVAPDDLAEHAGLADEERALLDRGAVGGRAGPDGRLVVHLGVEGGPCRCLEDAGGQPGQGGVQLRFQRLAACDGQYGGGQARAVVAPLLRPGAQHHPGVRGEVAVYLDGAAATVARPALLLRRGLVLTRLGRFGRPVLVGILRRAGVERDFGQVPPCDAVRGLPLGAALEHQYVDHDVGAGGGAHAALGQAHGADQVGQAGDVLARRRVGLVHRAGAGHEHGQPTGPQPGDGTRDEVVVQPQVQRRRGRVGAHDPVGEGRVADGEVEAAAERAPGVVLAAHPGTGMHQPRDAGGHRVVFHPGQAGRTPERFGQQGEEQPRPHARLQHAAAGEAEALHGAPQGADDGLRRVVGILGGALEGGILGRGHGVGEDLPDLVPSRAEPGLARQREGVLCQVGGAEADEAQQGRLLVWRRGAPAGI